MSPDMSTSTSMSCPRVPVLTPLDMDVKQMHNELQTATKKT